MTYPAPSPTAPDTARLFAPIVRGVGQAIGDYRMIEDGDRVMVCLSGGKDSYALLDVLLHLQKKAPVKFELVAVNLDQGQPGFPKDVLPRYLTDLGVRHDLLTQDTYSVVKEKTPEGKTTCALCSRLRRGILYGHARAIGATKIALGHHRDDILETLFMNLFFGARLKAMPPKLQSDDGTNVVIRPLAYTAEQDLIRYAQARQFPIIPCNLCGSQANLQRQVVGEMLEGWEREHPGRLNNILRALTRVTPSHLLDRDLFDFASLSVTPAEGDRGFDPDTYPEREFLNGLSEMQMLG
ncbi:tRNA 2-thiocytidine(32) synthetase TtcA [Deinococcus sp. HMF7604]|uniref:tRNA 2-thiocytidine(32) synthetase TtcA n=1 Tax=Deinococcus betulae TaxID=2873312 RepID=UPI001CCF0832|nr:tRNA 2-thiocytidine(32) synthetase TtcA [Deinococcus betulae]MBZ9750893.1 tRNA 2-thiocytidine(32) synthetase TtcA [Deinococcus betulae]